MIRERARHGLPGIPLLLLLLLAAGLAGYSFVSNLRANAAILVAVAAIVEVVIVFLMAGFFIVNPNEARVLQLFGSYAGTAKVPGLRWANPFFTKKRMSLRVR